MSRPDERAVARHFSGFPTKFSSGLPRRTAPRGTSISLDRLWQNCPILGPSGGPQIAISYYLTSTYIVQILDNQPHFGQSACRPPASLTETLVTPFSAKGSHDSLPRSRCAAPAADPERPWSAAAATPLSLPVTHRRPAPDPPADAARVPQRGAIGFRDPPNGRD